MLFAAPDLTEADLDLIEAIAKEYGLRYAVSVNLQPRTRFRGSVHPDPPSNASRN